MQIVKQNNLARLHSGEYCFPALTNRTLQLQFKAFYNDFKGEQGSKSIHDPCVYCKKSLLENAFYTLIRYFLITNPSKLELEAFAGTIAALIPTSDPNIYITPSVKRTGKIFGHTTSGPKLYVVLSIMCTGGQIWIKYLIFVVTLAATGLERGDSMNLH